MRLIAIILPLVLAADQYTKWLVRQHIDVHDKIIVIGGFFNLTHVQNPGAAFGLFRDLIPGIRTPLFLTTSIVAFIILFYLYRKTETHDWKTRVILALIASGALGNITDRILFGTVTDFLQVYYKQYYWPSFNVADSCITVGVILLILRLLFVREEEFNQIKQSSSPIITEVPEENGALTE